MLAYLWLLVFNLSYASALKAKHIIILAGQSNMSGRGGIVNNTWDRFVPSESRPSPSIFRLTASLAWVEARDPLHRDIDVNTTCGLGPGMSFANRILEKDQRLGPVGLVPCAVGGLRGTKISEWERGSFLYNQVVRRAKAARRGGGRIRAILWYQGESDTVSQEDANLYKRRLVSFFNQLRADLGSPFVPLIQVALASGQGPYIEKVRKAQLGTRLRNVKCVDAKGLPLLPDNLHLSTPGQVQLGQMLADTFFRFNPMMVQLGVTP